MVGMYGWIVDGISSLFEPLTGQKSDSGPGKGKPAAETTDVERQESSTRPAKRNYESIHPSDGKSEPLEIKRPRSDVALSIVKKTVARVADLLRIGHLHKGPRENKIPHSQNQVALTPLMGVDEVQRNRLNSWMSCSDVEMEKQTDRRKRGEEGLGFTTHHQNSHRQNGALLSPGVSARNCLQRSHTLLHAAPHLGTAPPCRTHKPCLTVEESLKENDRQRYRRLVEMVSEKYSRSKPLPFSLMKPLVATIPLDRHTDVLMRRRCETTKPCPPNRATSNVWRQETVEKQTGSGSGKVSPHGGGRAVAEELDLSAEVAARLNLVDREPVVPIRASQSGPESRRCDHDFPQLTREMQVEVGKALSQKDPNLVLSSAFKLRITQRDLLTLQEGSWLNDEVINFYLNLVMLRSEQQGGRGLRVYSFSTFFFPKLLGGGHGAVRRWTKAVDIFLYDIVLVPLHLGIHWALSVIDFRSRSVKYYDSMGQRHDDICSLLLLYMREEHKAKKSREMDGSKWTTSSMSQSEIPQQKNGSDCGVFVCKYADYIARGQPLTFRQCHMPLFRKLMIWEILNQRLL